MAGERPLIAVLDYGIGNLHSAHKGFEHAGADTRLTDDPGLIRNGVSELLRFDGPVQHTVRVATKPIVFAGANGEDVVAEPGSTILTTLGGANHDPAMFDDPHRLWLDRPNANMRSRSAYVGAGSGSGSMKMCR